MLRVVSGECAIRLSINIGSSLFEAEHDVLNVSVLTMSVTCPKYLRENWKLKHFWGRQPNEIDNIDVLVQERGNAIVITLLQHRKQKIINFLPSLVSP